MSILNVFNSRGIHIANFTDGKLYTPSGQNIGHYLKNEKIFIAMTGHYLGEIVNKNRLLFNQSSPYLNINYGNHGNYGSIGNHGNPGNHGIITMPAGFREVD